MSRSRHTRPAWNRRDVLKGGAAAAAGAAGLFPDFGAGAACPNEFDGSKFQLKARRAQSRSAAACCATASPCRPPHFDFHQSGTINNLGSQGCMFDNLVRRDPRDSGKTIIPDLAHSWEISPGRQDLHLLPAQGRAVPRRRRADRRRRQGHLRPHLQAAGGHLASRARSCSTPSSRDQRARQAHGRVQARRAAAAAFIMGAIACGWNGIVRKKTLEDNQYNLRRVVDIPGTGPFKSKRRVENEVWVMERHPNYWNKGLPYLDGIEFYHALPFSPELGSGVPVEPHRLCPPARSRHRCARSRRRQACPAPTSTRA